MRAFAARNEDLILRLGAGLTSGVFFAAAGIAASFAREHMAYLGAICGAGQNPHCGWCYGTAGLVLAGLAAAATAIRPKRR